MKNLFYPRGLDTVIEVWDYTAGRKRDCWIDAADLPLVQPFSTTWYASPIKNKRKWYAIARYYDAATKKSKTIMMHRVILGLTDPAVEGHHIDNDGLNNRRRNLEPCTHEENMRKHKPVEYWEKREAARALAAEYRKEREVARDIEWAFGLTRQQLWKIRNGEPITSLAAVHYRRAIENAGVRDLAQMKLAVGREGKFGIAWSGYTL